MKNQIHCGACGNDFLIKKDEELICYSCKKTDEILDKLEEVISVLKELDYKLTSND